VLFVQEGSVGPGRGRGWVSGLHLREQGNPPEQMPVYLVLSRLFLKNNFIPVLRNRDIFPGSEFFPSRIHSGSRIRIKEFKYFNPKKLLLSSRKYDPGCSSRIRILMFYLSRILDPVSRGQKGTGTRSGSATLFYSFTINHLPVSYFDVCSSFYPSL
jgi:hypothetical protein